MRERVRGLSRGQISSHCLKLNHATSCRLIGALGCCTTGAFGVLADFAFQSTMHGVEV